MPSAGLAGPAVGFPGDRIAEFLDNINARWDDIDGALQWFAANKDALTEVIATAKSSEVAAIIKAAAKLAAFIDVLIKEYRA